MNIKFTFKGSIILVVGVYLLNFLMPAILSLFQVPHDIAMVITNTIFSSALVTYVVTRVDGYIDDRKKIIKVYILIMILFFVVTTLWMRGVFI